MATAKKRTAIPKELIEKQQAEHEQYKKFDVFHARIKKDEVYSVAADKNVAIIVGWQLTEKAQPHPVFIEEDLIIGEQTGFNRFITNDAPIHKIYLPHGKFKEGEHFSYEQYADMLGIDKKKDKNIVLAN